MKLVIIDRAGRSHNFGEVEPYVGTDRDQLRAIARQLMSRHDHSAEDARDPLVRENCSACVLSAPLKARRWRSPNYAGWMRVYVEAGVRVPADRIIRELRRTDNLAYVAALKRDLVTFSIGVHARVLA